VEGIKLKITTKVAS